MSINEVRYLPECGSTNAYVKEHFEEFGPVGAVYTEKPDRRARPSGPQLGECRGQGPVLYGGHPGPLAQPATLPLLASLAVRRQLQLRYGVDCQIKWPNDLLLNGKKSRGHPVRKRELRLPAAGARHPVRHRHQSGPAPELF